MAPPWPAIEVDVDITDSQEDVLQKHRSMYQDVIRHAAKYPHARAGPAYVRSLAQHADTVIMWMAERIAAANRETNDSATTSPEFQTPQTAPYSENLENVSQRSTPPEIICTDDSNDGVGDSDASREYGENLSALHFLVDETEESDEDADDEEYESCESEGSGSEEFESEPSHTEPEDEIEQEDGESISAVQSLNDEIEGGVDDEEGNVEYTYISSEGSEGEDYESEPSDAEQDDQVEEEPHYQHPEDQEMEEDRPENDDQYDQDMDASSDFSDRPQGIYDWIPNHVEKDPPTEASAQPIEPVEHWPPDLSAWASMISNMPDSDPNKHLVRVKWTRRYPSSQLPPAEMKSTIRDICLQREVVTRSIKVQPSLGMVDIYVNTAADRSKLLVSPNQWLHMISEDDSWAYVDRIARPPPPRVPNKAHELPFTFRIHWTCTCPPYKGWTLSQDATPVVENIRAALENSGDSLLAAAAPRVHAVQFRPRSGDIWVYVCSISARDYMVRRENALLWVHRLKHGHRAQICLQEHRSARSAIATRRNPPLADTSGNSRRGGLEDNLASQKERRREKRRRQRARKRQRERQQREHRMHV